MTGLIAKFVFNKILHENVSNSQGRDDPYFETVPSTRLSLTGQPKTKRRRKALPPGLTREEERTLVKVKRRAYRLDMAFGECCGMKIGWSSLIAIVPAIGDVIDCKSLVLLFCVKLLCFIPLHSLPWVEGGMRVILFCTLPLGGRGSESSTLFSSILYLLAEGGMSVELYPPLYLP